MILTIKQKTRSLLSGLMILGCFSSQLMAQQSLTPSQSRTQSQHKFEALDNAISEVYQKHNVPSVAYAIVRQGQAPHVKVLGKINRELDLDAKADTPYRIASISKMIVGIAIMQLVESNRLSLDAHVADLLPDLQFSNPWRASHPLKVVHLLENTTGWNEISLSEYAYHNHPPLDLPASLSINPDSRTSRWPPGTRHAYTNSTAAVAAWIVESVTGMSFYSYAEQFIFAPLDIHSASYTEVAGTLGYRKGRAEPYKALLYRPAGALSMSIDDMAKLTQALIDDGVPLLSSATLTRMEHSHTTNTAQFEAGYGLYNFARYYQGHRFRGHDGALRGWLSELVYSPTHNVGFVVLQNSEQPRAFRRTIELISEHLMNEFASSEVSSEHTPDAWLSRSGYYRYVNPRVEKRYFLERLVASYKLSVKEDNAVLQSVFPPGWRRDLTYAGNNRFQNDKGEAVMALADDPLAGEVLHYGDRVFKRTSFISAWLDKLILVLWLVTVISLALASTVWGVQGIRGKYQHSAASIRKNLSLVSWSSVAFILFMAVGLSSPIALLGKPGPISLGLMLSSVVLALATVWACWQHFRLEKGDVSRWFYRYASLYLLLQASVVVYLGWFGVIGIRAWT